MHNKTANGSAPKSAQRRAAAALTLDDRIGMFEAGLEELSAAGVTFDARNDGGALVLVLHGLHRVDDNGGGWHIDPATNGDANAPAMQPGTAGTAGQRGA